MDERTVRLSSCDRLLSFFFSFFSIAFGSPLTKWNVKFRRIIEQSAICVIFWPLAEISLKEGSQDGGTDSLRPTFLKEAINLENRTLATLARRYYYFRTVRLVDKSERIIVVNVVPRVNLSVQM